MTTDYAISTLRQFIATHSDENQEKILLEALRIITPDKDDHAKRLSHFRKRMSTEYAFTQYVLDQICQDAFECFSPLSHYNKMAEGVSLPQNDLDHFKQRTAELAIANKQILEKSADISKENAILRQTNEDLKQWNKKISDGHKEQDRQYASLRDHHSLQAQLIDNLFKTIRLMKKLK